MMARSLLGAGRGPAPTRGPNEDPPVLLGGGSNLALSCSSP